MAMIQLGQVQIIQENKSQFL